MLLSEEVDSPYPELNPTTLQTQINIFKHNYKYKNLKEAAAVLRDQMAEISGLLNQVDILIQLLTVVPAGVAEAEGSFSALRRLKTWLSVDSTVWRFVSYIKTILTLLTKRRSANGLSQQMNREKLYFDSFFVLDQEEGGVEFKIWLSHYSTTFSFFFFMFIHLALSSDSFLIVSYTETYMFIN